MIKKWMIILLLLGLLGGTSICQAADGNSLAAVALYIDTGERYVPGMDLLNKALNEVIRFKVNALFLGSEVQSGNEVLRDLSRCGVATAKDACPEAMLAYSNTRHVNYIILVSARPLDVALDIKGYSLADNCFLIDKTVTRPDGSEALSTLDALSSMVGNELTELLQAIRK